MAHRFHAHCPLCGHIRSRKIDVVVVYKVDRLSRSLADFAQLMKLFDEHGVSFVSVTQQFNTYSSMGRLTLNVLLSFAQFEREVTGERIRDKIALSKQKGMWMGGVPPLGYDVRDRKLAINPAEAETVRKCFQVYLESTGLIETVLELNRQNLTTKSFVSRKGRIQQSKPWVAKELHRVISNPVYRGLIRHKDQEYQGEHEAIISPELWDAVLTKLREHQPDYRKISGHLNETSIAKSRLIHPLKGFLFGLDGQAQEITEGFICPSVDGVQQIIWHEMMPCRPCVEVNDGQLIMLHQVYQSSLVRERYPCSPCRHRRLGFL